jgi:HK97 family phage portal protein
MHVPTIPLRREPASERAAGQPASASIVPAVHAEAEQFNGFRDPRLLEFFQQGGLTQSGAVVNVTTALRNPTVIRCVSLISFAIGMLPLHLRKIATKEKADDHPLFRVLHRKPNPWQTAFEFRSLMQQRALVDGNAYAMIVRTTNKGKNQVSNLVPLDSTRVSVKQLPDWTLEYVYDSPTGRRQLRYQDVFHLRYGLSDDGISGLSLVKQAAEAIGVAIQTDRAAARLFRNGMLAGGGLKHPGKLSPDAYERLKASMEAREGAEMAHKWLILEEGMSADSFTQTGRDSQHLEMRKHQIEDVARPFGVPRPLLGIDETSWGSGIDALGQFFVRYGLSPWFESWEQAISRSLLTDQEAEEYEAKFNPGALLRGSMQQQADFFAKGLGAGGHHPFLEVSEVRGWMDLPESDNLPPPAGQMKTPAEGKPNDPAQAA